MSNSDSHSDSNSNDQYDEIDTLDSEDSSSKKSSEFAAMLNESLGKSQKKLQVGDKIKAEILVLSKEEVFVSTGTMHDGQVSRRDLLDADGNCPYKTGDVLDLYVTQVRGSDILLSPKKTAVNLAQDLEDAADMMLPVEGRVMELCKGGFRVQLLGKTAFCPISQIDTKRTETGEEYVGKKFEFLITQYGEKGKNIVVSRRKYLEEQRGVSEATFEEEHKVGDLMKGVITRVEKFGAFAEIAPGIEGMIHVSELGWSRIADAHEAASVGQEVTVKILKIETVDGRMRIALSVKQTGDQPWEKFPSDITEGAIVTGKVTRCMKFGAFVEIAPGIEGLVPLGEMSYTKRVMTSDELFKEGERISVKVKEIHPETRKILLSLKDAGSGDPWSMVEYKFAPGTIVSGKVERREPYGLFIKLEDGVTGLFPKSKANEQPEFPFEKLKLGDTVTVQVAEVKTSERRISLCAPSDASAEEWKNYKQSGAGTGGGGSLGTLGDLFKKAAEKKTKK